MSAPVPICPCPCGQPVKPGNKYASKGCVGRARQGKPLTPEARANVAAANQRRAAEPVLPEVSPELKRKVEFSVDHTALLVDGVDAVLGYGPEVQDAAKQALEVFAARARLPHEPPLAPAKPDPYAIVAELARAHEPHLLRAAAELREKLAPC